MTSPAPVLPQLDGSPPAPPAKPLSLAKRALVMLLVFLGIALCVVKALLWSGGRWNAEVSGYAIGALLVSLAVSYGVAGRKKNRKPVLFGLIFAGVAFVLCMMEGAHPRKDPNAEVADLIREASGTKSIDRRGAFDSPQDKLLREVMATFLDSAKTHGEKGHKFEAGLMALYTPESFSSVEAMNRTRDSVQSVAALDHEFVLEIEQWPARVHDRAAQSALSEPDKQEFLKGFEQGFSNSEIVTLRKQGDEIEAKWCEETLALYDFARSQAGRIHVKNGHILVDDANVRIRFNDLLQQARGQLRKMEETNAQLAKLQQDNLQKFGLTKKDIGVAQPSETKAN